MTVVGVILMISGALLGLIGGVGVARLGSTLARTQAASKPASLGMFLVALGAGVAARSWALVGVAVVVGVFQFVTAPIAGHMVGRSSARLEVDPQEAPPSSSTPGFGAGALVGLVAVLWVILWRDASLGVLLAGVLVGVALVPLVGRKRGRALRFGAIVTAVEYTLSLIRSNFRTAVQVVRMNPNDVAETVVWCELETRSIRAAVFTANAISFTPGTLTLEFADSVPYRIAVHAMGMTREEVIEDVARLESAADRAGLA